MQFEVRESHTSFVNSSSSAGSMSVMSPQGLEVAITIGKLLPSIGEQMHVDSYSLLKFNIRKIMSGNI